jgi:hypothetical protein
MTFNDLNFIEKTFTKMLISIHHHRISYPELPVERNRQEPSENPRGTPRDNALDRDPVGGRRATF